LDTQLARHQFDVLQGEIRERQTAAEDLRSEIETNSASVLRCEDEIVELRGRMSELEHEIAKTQQHGLELKSESDRHESRIHFNEERLREFAAQNTKALADMTQAEERKLIAEQELGTVAEQLAASEAALEQHRQALAAKQDALAKLEEDLKRQHEALRVAQA